MNEPSRGHSWFKKHRQYLGCSYPRVLILGPKRHLSPLQGLMPAVWMWCWGLCSSKAWSCPLSSGLSDSPLITCSAETGGKFKPLHPRAPHPTPDSLPGFSFLESFLLESQEIQGLLNCPLPHCFGTRSHYINWAPQFSVVLLSSACQVPRLQARVTTLRCFSITISVIETAVPMVGWSGIGSGRF